MALRLRRRSFLSGLLAYCLPARAEGRRFRIAFANLDETPGVTLEGLGFTGSELRRSFELAARTLPVDMSYFDNAGDPTPGAGRCGAWRAPLRTRQPRRGSHRRARARCIRGGKLAGPAGARGAH